MSFFGKIFRISTYGESHCESVGCIIEGSPAGFNLKIEEIQKQLTRRRPGQSVYTTSRNETDLVVIHSGLENGVTLGSPILMMVKNEDQKPNDYSEINKFPRPSHADLTYLYKYNIKSLSGGGRASARETIGRVAAGALAEQMLEKACGIEIVAFVSSIGEISIDRNPLEKDFQRLISKITRKEVDDSGPLRCPDHHLSKKMEKLIQKCKDEQDSIGGIVTCVIRNCPVGLGEPCFDKLEACLALAMMSIPATKGFELGSGFFGSKLHGSQNNDLFYYDNKTKMLRTSTNNSGGIQGGISNGENIYFSVAFKPAATISRSQKTAKYSGEMDNLIAKGRHDPCLTPRAVPIVESMAALVIMDNFLIQRSKSNFCFN